VIGRDLSIVLLQAPKSLQPHVARRAARSLLVFPLVVAALLLAKVPLGASNSPSRSTNKPNAPVDATKAVVLGVRSSRQIDYSRVVIDLSANVQFKVGHLSNPDRLYLDLSHTEIGPQLASRRIAFQDGIVNQIRMATDPGAVTRIVLDLRMAVRYQVSKLDDPVRILVELGQPQATAPVDSIRTGTTAVRQASGQIPASDGSTSMSTSSQSTSSQSTSSTSSNAEESRAASASGPHSYGDAEKTGLSYAGTSQPPNALLLGLNMGSSYDDNIFSNNEHPVGDVNFLFGPSLSLRRKGRRLSLALSYQPYFRIYRKVSEQNGVDQTLGFDATYRTSSRVSFRARGSAFYRTGIFQPSQNDAFLPGLGSPSSLNNTLFTPTARQLSWSARIDGTYQASAHDSLGLFVSRSALDYRQQISNEGNLQNTEKSEAGLLYQHRLSPHTTVGIDYLYQDIRFGSESRTLVHSAFFSYAQQVSPSLTLSVFGGPQYSQLHDVVTLALGPFTPQIPVFQAAWNWAIGGTVTKQADKAAFQLSAQHQVSDGGGLLGAVVSSSLGASVRRRLPGRWDAIWNAGYADNSSFGSEFSQGAYQSITAGAGLERPLTDKLTVRLKYDFIRQRGTEQSPLFRNFDRDLWSLQFSYAFHQIALGR
jgi:AMIN domain-containing protein